MYSVIEKKYITVEKEQSLRMAQALFFYVMTFCFSTDLLPREPNA